LAEGSGRAARLRRENKRLEQANEILRCTVVFVGREVAAS
jgi:hypothetical protein